MLNQPAACVRPEEAKEGKRANVKEKRRRRGLKGPDYGTSLRIKRVPQQLSSKIRTLLEDDSRNKRPARTEAVFMLPPRSAQENAPPMLAAWTRNCAFICTEKPSTISSFQKRPKWPGPRCNDDLHNNKDVISRRVEGMLLCTSVGLAARFFDFYLYTYLLSWKTFSFFLFSAEKCRRWKCDTL